MTRETVGGWVEEIPHLDSIELLENGNVRVMTSDMNDQYMVDLHPMHLRFIAEKMGLVREMSASEADALRMVDKLGRRLRVLHGRIEQLHKWLGDAPDMENADIIAEYWHTDATLDLAKEFIAEIEESRAVVTPMSREQRDQSRDFSVTDQSLGSKPKGKPAGPNAQGNLPV